MHAAEFDLKDFGVQSFRRYIKEFVVAEDAVLQCDDNLFARHAGVDGGCLDAPFAQVSHLVFHQGNQRGNDQA